MLIFDNQIEFEQERSVDLATGRQMNIFTAILIFGLTWWVCLFMVLPRNIRSQMEDEDIVPGSEPGAPSKPQLLRKLWITTLLATVFFALIMLLLLSGLFDWQNF